MRLHLPVEPVDRRITLRARALGRTGLFRKIKIHVDRLQLSDHPGVDYLLRLDDCRQIVPVPEQEFHVIALNHLNEPIALGQAGGHRLIGDYVQPGIGRAHSKITMPLGLRTDRRHVEIILSNRLGTSRTYGMPNSSANF